METQDEPRRRAYRAAARITRRRIEKENPLDADALLTVEAADILVVPGSYDHVEAVLDALEMPYRRASAHSLSALRLRPEQLLVINCPGHVPRAAIGRIRDFVEAGGSLFSTDWTLHHVIEAAFPGVIAYNERPTADDVVRIEVRSHDNPFLRGVMDGSDDPQWWLEGSSYPISILDPARVEVLIRSRELEAKYGEAPVAVLFRHGDGEVFHMISHYYLQRTELRTDRHRKRAVYYAEEKGVELDPATAACMADLSLGEVESAASSARLFANIVAAKKRGGAK